MKNVLITGSSKDFDKQLVSVFIQENYKVYVLGNGETRGAFLLSSDLNKAASEIKNDTGYIDIYIDVSDERSVNDNFNIQNSINEKVMRELYDINVTLPMAMLEVFLPLLEAGNGKRLCYLTSTEASINETKETCGYGYKMAKAGLHNFLQITRNALAPKGYSLRVFDPMMQNVSTKQAAEAAFNYFTRGRGVERGDPYRDDENNLVFRDAYGRQHSW
jgi:NAD(P)-dependent dehydrogenase (short-subunit alcohol dehydrogenase family)